MLGCLLSHFDGSTGSSWFLFPFCAADRGMDATKCCFYGGEISLEVGAGLKSGGAGNSLGTPLCPLVPPVIHPQPKDGDLACPHPPGLCEKVEIWALMGNLLIVSFVSKHCEPDHPWA